ncbi:MAG: prepilin-type N-terminal cleavage/methylation domain-containing protein [Phycisphaerales bacterium]|nr:prepilin-type N-terminal cleavage/methylation domain-containing protein [Phycisphaerales bacterium]
MPPFTRHRPRAFTLVEAITTIVIIAIVSTISATLVRGGMNVYDSAATRAELSDRLSVAMDRITTELRTMDQTGSTGSNQASISALTTSSITFTASGATRTISLSGTNLLLSGSLVASAVLAPDITTFSLLGFDSTNTALPASPSAPQIATLRRIQITISATRNGITETLRTKVFIRELASGSGAP